MALTPSTMLPLGTAAPDFSLPDTDGNTVSLADFDDCKALVVMFICNHCPYVKHLADALAVFGKEYQARGVGVVAICSNDAENYPDDSPEKMKQEKQLRGYTFAYLHDESQAVARAYHAACTPDFFVFDGQKKLVYRGQFDDTRPTGAESGVDDASQRPTGADLRAAVDAAMAGEPAPAEQKPSLGCNIKWKEGAAPAYA